jgi:hypothetical protein
VKLTTSPSPDWHYWFTNDDAWPFIYNYGNTGYNYFFIQDGGFVSINDGLTMSTNTWYHFVGVYQRSVVWKMYRNGAETASGATTYYPNSRSYISIGASEYGDRVNALGQFHDFRIYNRVLTANEIQTIYACAGTDGIVSGLTLRLPMDEGYEGQTVATTAGLIKDVSNYKTNATMVTSSGTPIYTSGPFVKRRLL